MLFYIFYLFSHVQWLSIDYVVLSSPELVTFNYAWYIFKLQF